MFLLEVLIKVIFSYLKPHKLGVKFLFPSMSETCYYYCTVDLKMKEEEFFLLMLYTFFQILIRSIIIIVICYLYRFIKKTAIQYYPAKYITRHLICKL